MGVKKGFNFFPWPTLSDETINKNGNEIERWKRLICFPLDILPDKQIK